MERHILTLLLHLMMSTFVITTTHCDSRVYMNVHASLHTVPQDIPDNVTVVNLAGNLLVNLTAGCFDNLTHVEGMKLSNNHIVNIEREVSLILSYLILSYLILSYLRVIPYHLNQSYLILSYPCYLIEF